jgi:glutathione synthase/RimK-type ligase-like ATP-grasp enzyme
MTIKAMFSYNNASAGADELKNALGIPKVKHNGSKFVGSAAKTILNWGAGTDRMINPEILKCRLINHPTKVDVAVDKLKSFNAFQAANVPIPEFTGNRATAISWLEQGAMVFARTQLRASSGRGIVIMDPDHQDTWEANANLYVKYKAKKHEYRIHVVAGQVVDTQRKGLRQDLAGQEGINFKIRNLANGFVFVRNDANGQPHAVPACVLDAGRAAVQALQLDFGAADVIYNHQENRAYVLEVNTAPGLQGQTVTSYATALAANF